MAHSVYFPQNLVFLRKERLRLSQDKAAPVLGLKRSTLANYENGDTTPDFEIILNIARYFGVNPGDLLFRDLSKGNLISKKQDEKSGQKGNVNGNPIGNLNEQNEALNYGKKHPGFMPKVITVDATGEENILYVPVQARAGYLLGYSDPKYLETLPSFRMPGLRNGTFRMFDVGGPSMAPTLSDQDKVIGQYVERFEDIRDGRVYVVVTDDGIVVKRVLNRISERGKLVLKSDTIAHRSEFKTYEIPYESVKEIWYVRLKISADFTEPSEVYHRLNDLESEMVEQREINKSILFQMDEIREIISGKRK